MTSVPSAEEAIATFTAHPTPLAFLSVVQALSDVPSAKKRLTSLWEAHRAQITPLTAHDVADVLSWLSEITPLGTFEEPRQELPQPPPAAGAIPAAVWTEKLKDRIVEAGRLQAPYYRQAERLLREIAPHAGYFGGGYSQYVHFAEFFKEKNPIEVIGDHTRRWFTPRKAGEAARSITQRTLSSSMCAYLHTVWLPALSRMIDDRHDNKILKQLALWLRSDQTLPLVVGRPEYFSASRRRQLWQFDFQLIADTLPLFPQSYFERVLNPLSRYLGADGGFDDDAQYDYVEGLCDVLLSLPIGASSPHALADLHDGALTALVEKYGLEGDNLPYVPLSLCQTLISGCASVSISWCEIGGYYLCDRDEFHTLCSRLSDACDRQLASNACMPNDWIGLAWMNLTELTHPDNLAACPLPLPLLLATTDAESVPFLEDGPSCWTPYSWASYGFRSFSPADAECGLRAVDLAATSHYWELANALFAFVVFRGLICSKTALLCDWSQLMATYKRLEGTPGHDMAREALIITTSALQELSPGSFHTYLLQQWSRCLQTPPPAQSNIWNSTEESLRDRLLVTVWPRLSRAIQSQIMNAEVLWTLQHQYLGTTEAPSGAPLVLEYAKCIEVPLREGLRPVLDSLAFKEYQQATQNINPGNRPTFGNMVHLLLDRQCPLPLQREMGKLGMSGIDIAALQDMAPELKIILRERNAAAHESVTATAAMQFRERLYAGGVFARLYSSLYPA